MRIVAAALFSLSAVALSSGIAAAQGMPVDLDAAKQTAAASLERLTECQKLGVVWQRVDGKRRVVGVQKGCAVDLAGIKIDDELVSLDGVNLAARDDDFILSMLRGDKDPTTELKVRRNEALLTFTVRYNAGTPTRTPVTPEPAIAWNAPTGPTTLSPRSSPAAPPPVRLPPPRSAPAQPAPVQDSAPSLVEPRTFALLIDNVEDAGRRSAVGAGRPLDDGDDAVVKDLSLHLLKGDTCTSLEWEDTNPLATVKLKFAAFSVSCRGAYMLDGGAKVVDALVNAVKAYNRDNPGRAYVAMPARGSDLMFKRDSTQSRDTITISDWPEVKFETELKRTAAATTLSAADYYGRAIFYSIQAQEAQDEPVSVLKPILAKALDNARRASDMGDPRGPALVENLASLITVLDQGQAARDDLAKLQKQKSGLEADMASTCRQMQQASSAAELRKLDTDGSVRAGCLAVGVTLY